ncbi:MAG: YdcF family protein [Defluviitaleaceae bacterium]|nr:YdcF family protein [Defluviitaleaceae bacterium]
MTRLAKILRIVLITLGILLLINYIGLMIIGNVHFGNKMVALAAVVLVVYAFFMNKLPKWVHMTVILACLIPIVFSTFLAVYGNRDVPYEAEVDVVIVLGAGLRGEEPGTHLAARLDAAAEFLHRDPHAMVIVSGGYGINATISEAEAMARYLIALGIAPDRIRLENRSTSTYENLRFSLEIMENYFYNPHGTTAVVVTNQFHIYRATRQARRLGMTAVVPLGAPTPRSGVLSNYFREMLAVVNFWVFS